jgi:hypothetical protein
MTEAQAIELVFATFAAAWPAASGSLPLALENEALPTAPSFGMVTIKHTVSQPRTSGGLVGTRRVERRGWIFVKLWGPVAVGRKGISTLADAVRGILEIQQLGGSGDQLTIDAGLTQEAGTDDAYCMLVVQFPFRYYAMV